MYNAELVTDLFGEKRLLSFVEDIPRHVCGYCFAFDVCLKCYICRSWICDGCTEWFFKRKKQKIRVYDVECQCGATINTGFA